MVDRSADLPASIASSIRVNIGGTPPKNVMGWRRWAAKRMSTSKDGVMAWVAARLTHVSIDSCNPKAWKKGSTAPTVS